MCEEKFYNQADAKGDAWVGGGAGPQDWFTEGQSPNYDSARFTKALVTLMKFKGLLRYQKPHVTDYIAIYAFAYNVQYADSLYCCVYWNISDNIQCRITNFLHCDVTYAGSLHLRTANYKRLSI